ncbi:M20 family metallopeptidase [Phycicoccus endophyticus]|uniref:M20 family metallopeptidase n=1 Tax=Phycicoccus endophyticus TaxID=1690220 RepID=A0A7G9R208_9MICO|nr:M20 family metallopeptidase [Phycicoccus endophyticus]NHI19732.1 M20 family metallopeptidase [Phycicoccus endophyticus]QNN49633.1 M20 family metallopeptidase [Phycicoccus endophyticus]GGL33501.1 succinyl-diaminopimelate desuccinylase [Phycicoccus endophyticus]
MTDVLELARELIRTPSPVVDGDERAVAALMADVLTDAGLPRPTVHALDPTRPNLLTTLDFGAGGAHLVLCGHLDTKPVGDAAWSADPFGADLDGDRLYGLGSGDMKAGVAAMTVAAERLAEEPPRCGRLSLLLTADEENGAVYGSQFLGRAVELAADGMVIGEPGGIAEDFDRLHVSSRGLARFDVLASARQGHSSLSSVLGMRNAGADVAAAVTRLHGAELVTPLAPPGVRDWNATVNAGLAYRGGWGYGVLPDHVSALVEVRTLPGMTPGAVLAELTERAREGADGADVEVRPDATAAHWIDASPLVPADGALVRAAEAAGAAVLGHRPPTSVFPGTTDASWLAGLGTPCLPALGPGLLARAHGADEWVSVRAVHQAADLYEQLARAFCAPTAGEPR